MSLKLIKHFLVFFYIVIEHGVGAVEPLLLGVGMWTDVLANVSAHLHKGEGILVEVLVL